MDSKNLRFNPGDLIVNVQRMTTKGKPIVSPREVIGLSEELFQNTSSAQSIPLTSGGVKWNESSTDDMIKSIKGTIEKLKVDQADHPEKYCLEDGMGFLGYTTERRLHRLSLDEIVEGALKEKDLLTLDQQLVQRNMQAEMADRIAKDKVFNDVMKAHRERLESLGIPARKLFGIGETAQEDADKMRIYSGGRGVGKSFALKHQQHMVKQFENLLERTYKGYEDKPRRIQRKLRKKLLNKYPEFKYYVGVI